MEKNYTGKSLFNFVEYNHLFQVISSSKDEFAKDDLEIIDDALTQCRRYVDVVDTTEQQIKLAYVRFDGDDLRDKVMNYDRQRRSAHEAAISSANVLNRLSGMYGCKKIYNGGEDRLEVADFCLEVVVELFENRIR